MVGQPGKNSLHPKLHIENNPHDENWQVIQDLIVFLF
jgi:hypothetical protein